ncbi:platelet-activating factor acetylhydrolase-like [Dysidea avara]|uniref:platelet-activating factor acetylhydrolase-like n=1 Tax=Dysidea avara TaxID=196820 RepID=UPI00332A0021
MAVNPGWRQSGMLQGIGLPVPSGPHQVGCVDVMPLCKGDDSGLLFRLYYPTEATPDSGYHYPPWLPDNSYSTGFLLYKRFPYFAAGVLGPLTNMLLGGQKMPALHGAPVTTSTPLPVIMFSHGVAGMRTLYSAVCCDLASHGYLVAAIEHRDHSAGYCYTKHRKNGSEEFVDHWIPYDKPPSSFEEEHTFRVPQLTIRRKEILLGLDFIHQLDGSGEFENLLQSDFDFKQFKGKLDLVHTAMMGHSFGGATTVTALADDKRFRVGIGLDTYMMPVEDGIEDKVEQPLLFINTWNWQWYKNIIKMKQLVDVDSQTDKYPTRQLITLRGSYHEDQSDVGFVYMSTPLSSVNPDLANIHTANMKLCVAFLNRHLWNDSTYPVKDLDESDTDSSGIVYHGTNVEIESKS